MKVRVRGLVHGVYFRGSLSQLANAENVTGWVRNVADGSVEAVLEGDEASVGRLVDWVGHGPPGARVDSVQVVKTELRRAKGFRILG